MTLFDPDPKLRWLFFLTHPDDELSICAWIRRLALAGSDVFLSWTHSNEEREAEARSAAEELGVPQDRLFFHASPDGGVLDDLESLLPRFQELTAEIAPDRIVCGAFEQGHLDHDATNYLANRVAKCPVLEVPWYHTYANLIQAVNRFAQPDGQQVLSLEPGETEFKKRLARMYPSQRIGDLLVWYEVWRRLRGSREGLAETERLRLQTHRDFLTPNLPPKLAGRVRRTGRWRTWEAAILAFDEEPG